MSARPLVVLKVGGSLVSDKAGARNLDLEALAGYARRFAELAQVADAVLVAGGGAFGHGAVRGLDPGSRTAALGLTEATFAVKWAWVRALADAGVPALPVQVAAVATVRDGRPEMTDDVVRRLLDAGVTPVLAGDCVPDATGHLRVVGSDVVPLLVVERLARPARVVMLTDVPGILTGGPGGDVVPLVDPDDPAPAFEHLWETPAWDTSGSMAGKLGALLACAASGADCTIMRGSPDLDLTFLARPRAQWPPGLVSTRVSSVPSPVDALVAGATS